MSRYIKGENRASLTILLSFEHCAIVYSDECSKTHMQHGYNWKFSLMFARFGPPGDPVRRSTRVYYVLNINILRARGINRVVVVGGISRDDTFGIHSVQEAPVIIYAN